MGNTSGRQLLRHAAWRRWDDIRFCVKKGADVTYRDSQGNSALHLALENPNVPVDVISILIHPDLINSIGGRRLTPLHIAAYGQNKDVIQELLRVNADPNIKRHYGISPLDFYIERMSLPLDVSILEALVPCDFRIDMMLVLERFGLSILRFGTDQHNIMSLVESVLRFFIIHAQVQYKTRISVQQISSANDCQFVVSSEPNINSSSSARRDKLFSGTNFETSQMRFILVCLIKCGYTIKFHPVIQHNPNAYNQHQQQDLEFLSDIKTIYSKYKHQEENATARLFDLCCSVVRLCIQRPIRAEKYRQLNLPSSIVRLLTSEDIADQVFDEIKKCRKPCK